MTVPLAAAIVLAAIGRPALADTAANASSAAATDVAAADAAPADAAPAQSAAAPAQATTSASPFTAGWQDGFNVQSANGDYRLVIGLLTQFDGRFSTDSPTPITNTFSIRKARPVFAGRVAKYFDYRFMPDFGNGTTALVDAYLDTRFSSKFRVRVGKDKTPVGYELLISDAGLFFPERSLASLLVPNRDVGVQAQGDLAGGKISYSGGVFNGIPDGTSESTEVDTNNGKDVAGRLLVQPFRAKNAGSAQNGLGFQIGGSTGHETGALPSFKTSVGENFFSYASGVSASGKHTRVTPAVFYYHDAFGAFAEYVRSSQAVSKSTTSRIVSNEGWDVNASYILAGGGTASDRPVRPAANFDPPSGHWGAVQVVARYAELRVDADAFDAGFEASGASRKAQQYTVGLNWYANYYIKYYLDYERTVFDGHAAGSRPIEDVIFLRVQLAF